MEYRNNIRKYQKNIEKYREISEKNIENIEKYIKIFEMLSQNMGDIFPSENYTRDKNVYQK